MLRVVQIPVEALHTSVHPLQTFPICVCTGQLAAWPHAAGSCTGGGSLIIMQMAQGCGQNDGAVSGYRYRRGLLGLRVEGLPVAGPEGWLRRAGKALLQTVPIAQVPASSLQALGSPSPPGAESCAGVSECVEHLCGC